MYLGKRTRSGGQSTKLPTIVHAGADISVLIRCTVPVPTPRVSKWSYHIGPDGSLVLDFEILTRDQAAALQEVTVETYMEGRGKNAREVKKVRFKLAGKRAALVDLGRYHKLFTDKFEHGGKDGRPIEGKITIEFVEPPKRKDEVSPRTRGRGSP